MGLLGKLFGRGGGGHTTPGRAHYATTVATPASAVKSENKPLLDKRGWKRNGREYVGGYATRYGVWQGEIERAGDRSRVMIKNAPMQWISLHPKAGCFYPDPNRSGWHRINLHTEPCDGDPSAIIAYVERVIVESRNAWLKTQPNTGRK